MQKKEIPASAVVPIISDGAIAISQMGEGRLIPVLVIDCDNRPDLRELVFAHEHLPPGDVKITWGRRRFQKKAVFLYLQFERPAQVDVLLEFDIADQGGLVDGILHARGVYLQPKESGKRVVEGMNREKILVEVPDTGFIPTWEELLRDAVTKRMRKRGLNRKAAQKATDDYIHRIRELWRLRMGSSRDAA